MCSEIQYQGPQEVSFQFLEDIRSLWLHFFVWNTDHLTADSHSRIPVLCPCLGLSAVSATVRTTHSCSSARRDSLLFLAGLRKSWLEPASSPLWAEPTADSRLQGHIYGLSSLLASSLCSCLPTFKCFNVQISQVSLCVEQGILCLVKKVSDFLCSRLHLSPPAPIFTKLFSKHWESWKLPRIMGKSSLG